MASLLTTISPFNLSVSLLQDQMRQIQDIFDQSHQSYGSPRLHAELLARGFKVSRPRVARLMQAQGLQAKMYKRFNKPARPYSSVGRENLVQRQWSVAHPNKVWVADITFIKVNRKWCYLAVVLDVFSRKIVGMAFSDHMRTDLVLQALRQALHLRQPEEGLIHHSDRGSQYTSGDLQRLARHNGIALSYGRCVYDNALVESFFHTLKTEWVYFKTYQTLEQARLDIFHYIFAFYNTKRRHSSLNYDSPHQTERHFYNNKNISV